MPIPTAMPGPARHRVVRSYARPAPVGRINLFTGRAYRFHRCPGRRAAHSAYPNRGRRCPLFLPKTCRNTAAIRSSQDWSLPA